MIEKFIKSIFGDPSEKKVKEISKYIDKIKEIEKTQEKFTLKDVEKRTNEFKAMFE
jgi:preprotein translocase subunit SecA